MTRDAKVSGGCVNIVGGLYVVTMKERDTTTTRISRHTLDSLRRAWAAYALTVGGDVKLGDLHLIDRAAAELTARLRKSAERIARAGSPALPGPVEIQRGGRATGAAMPIMPSKEATR